MSRPGKAGANPRGHAGELAQVGHQRLAGARVLHLDGHVAVPSVTASCHRPRWTCPIDAAAAGAPSSCTSRCSPVLAERAGDLGAHGAGRHRRRGVLQPCQLVAVRRGDRLRQRGLEHAQGLPELHRTALELARACGTAARPSAAGPRPGRPRRGGRRAAGRSPSPAVRRTPGAVRPAAPCARRPCGGARSWGHCRGRPGRAAAARRPPSPCTGPAQWPPCGARSDRSRWPCCSPWRAARVTPRPEGTHSHAQMSLPVGDGTRQSEVGYSLTDVELPGAAGGTGEVSFRIENFRGRPVTDYVEEQTQDLHLYVVRDDLEVFRHLHPTLAGDGTWSAPGVAARVGGLPRHHRVRRAGRPRQRRPRDPRRDRRPSPGRPPTRPRSSRCSGST